LTIVVIGGTPYAPLQAVEAHLQALGMAAPQRCEFGEVQTINDWIERYFVSGVPAVVQTAKSRRGLFARLLGRPQQAAHAVSTPWALAISNLILANSGQPVWGWCNRRNEHLAEFWLGLDPRVKFVGVVTAPEQALALAQQESGQAVDAPAVLEVWRQTIQRLLTLQRQEQQRVRLMCTQGDATQSRELSEWLGIRAAEADMPLPRPDALLVSAFAQQVEADAETMRVWRAVQAELRLRDHDNEDFAAVALQAAKLITGLEAELESARAAAAEAQRAADIERSSLQQRLQDHEAQKSELQRELESARAAAAEAQRAADVERSSLQQRLQDHESQKSELQRELESARAAAAEAQRAADVERSSLQQRLQDHESQKSELQAESDLLLSQLHQVQEELERYFLDAQALKQENEKLQQRVVRLLERLPGTVEWDELTAKAGKTSLTLTLRQVLAAQRTLPQLQLELARENKQLTLQVVDADANTPTLLHGALEAPLLPAALPGSPDSAALEKLATSDLALLQSVCTSLAPVLPATVSGRDQWAADLAMLAEQLKNLPPAWRYDVVTLVKEQVNPDYEHLWFRFDNASFGSRHWPSFEFRLSAANVRKGKFSQHPKLEFPDPGPGLPKQFENWFEESEDDYGVKYELRFDLRKTAMDMAAWSALSDEDQAQMLSIIDNLPRHINRLEENDVNISRQWADWLELTNKLRGVISSLGIA